MPCRHLQQTKADITPINVLLTLGMLPPEKLREWQQGRIPFLEAVLTSNLSKTNRVLRILRLHAADLNLRIVPNEYVSQGRVPSKVLQFSRRAQENLENAYARIYLPADAPPLPDRAD